MIVHSHMHQIGGYYNVPSLQSLAVKKFKDAAKDGIAPETFDRVVSVVYSGDIADLSVRKAVVSVSQQNMKTLLSHNEFLPSVTKNPEYTASLIKEMSEEYQLEMDSYMQTYGAQETDLATMKQQLDAEKAAAVDRGKRLGERVVEVQSLERLVGLLQPCRSQQCSRRFNYSVRRDGSGKPYIQCTACGQQSRLP